MHILQSWKVIIVPNWKQ